MSDTDKKTCPVCFTRMRMVKHVLTCPECGYKYCDHGRDNADLYSTSHTHEPNYTSYTSTTTYSSPTTSGTTYSSASQAQNAGNYSSNQSASRKKAPNTFNTSAPRSSSTTYHRPNPNLAKSAKKKWFKIVIIIYVVSFIISGVFPMVSRLAAIAFTSIDFEDATQAVPDFSDPDSSGSFGEHPIELNNGENDLIPKILCNVFDTDDWSTVTEEQIATITTLYLHQTSENTMYVFCQTNTLRTEAFSVGFDNYSSADIGIFTGLVTLDASFIHFEEGDLLNLFMLDTLSCMNTPDELLDIVPDPTALTNLSLCLPEGTDSLDGIEYFDELLILTLDASMAQVEDAALLSFLPNLSIMSYRDNGNISDCSFLQNMTALTKIQLRNLNIRDLDFLHSLSGLQYITIVGSDITDLTPLLSQKETLIELSLNEIPNLSDCSVVGELTGLTSLDLEACPQITSMEFASSLKDLKSLNIHGTSITDYSATEKMPQLTIFYSAE